MRRLIALLFLVLLSACASSPQPVLPTATAAIVQPLPTSPSVADGPQCQSVAAQPTPDASAPSLFAKPGLGMYDHLRGADSAPATIVVYSDFACPTCAALSEILNRLA